MDTNVSNLTNSISASVNSKTRIAELKQQYLAAKKRGDMDQARSLFQEMKKMKSVVARGEGKTEGKEQQTIAPSTASSTAPSATTSTKTKRSPETRTGKQALPELKDAIVKIKKKYQETKKNGHESEAAELYQEFQRLQGKYQQALSNPESLVKDVGGDDAYQQKRARVDRKEMPTTSPAAGIERLKALLVMATENSQLKKKTITGSKKE